MKKITFTVTTPVSMENSYTSWNHKSDVEMEVTIGIDDNNERGYFEFYDTESGGEEWYAEGGLWFENNTLTDYDGIFELPTFIIDHLELLGFDCGDMKESLN